MADDLEFLDNATLRKKCMQYGLPNVPVTNTSRNILIKRIRKSMGGLSVEKPDDLKSPQEARKVQDKVMNVVDIDTEIVAEPKNKAHTPTMKTRRTIAHPATIAEHDLAEEEPPVHKVTSSVGTTTRSLANEVPQRDIRTVDHAMRLGKRSPSLSKSGVVTTSYFQDVEVPEPPRNNPYTEDTYAKNKLYPDISTDVRLTHEAPLFNTNTASSDMFAYNYVSNVRPQPIRRTTNAYDTPERSTLAEDDAAMRSPYLSDFARRLDQLKDDNATKLRKSTPGGRTRDGAWPSYSGRPSDQQWRQHDGGVIADFRNSLMHLQAKYDLKGKLIFTLIVLAAIFIYVFFFL